MLRTVKWIGSSGDQEGGMNEKQLLQFRFRCWDDLTVMFPEMLARKLLYIPRASLATNITG